MHAAENSSALPADVRLSHLKFLGALCDPKNTKHYTENRREIVTHNGLLPIVLCLKECDEVLLDSEPSVISTASTVTVSAPPLQMDDGGITFAHQVACKLVLQIAGERSLLFSILRARVQEGLEKMLSLYASLPTEDICMALDVLDMIGANALKCSNSNMDEDDYVVYENNRRVRLFHDEDADDDDASACPDELEDENEKALYKKATRQAIVDLLVQPPLIEHVITCLYSSNPNVFLGAVMVLHKMACTQGYNNVLIEVIAFAGRALDKVVENLQSQDPNIPHACLALLKQLATKQSGRDGMISSKCVDMLMPLVCGDDVTNSRVFVLAMSVFVNLAQDGEADAVIAFSGPQHSPPPKNELYNDLMTILTREGKSPFTSIEHLLDMKVMQYVINFLVRPENPNLFFDLSNHHKEMGAVILHRMSLHKEACQLLIQDAALKYFAFTIQVNFIKFIEHHYGHSQSEQILFFTSTQAACRGLAQIANFVEGGHKKVLETIAGENIYKEVEDLLGFSAVKLDDFWAPKLDCTDAAACLVGAVARPPVAEMHAEAQEESLLTLRDDMNSCIPVLKRLIEQMARGLMAIVCNCPSKGAVNSACLALAKLASTNETSAILVEMGAAKIVATLFPEKPGILHAEKDSSKSGVLDVAVKKKLDKEVDQLLGLDANCYMFVSSLCRTPEGKVAIQSSGILKRCVERFHLSSGKKGIDLVIRGEIASIFGRLANSQIVTGGSAGAAIDYITNPNYNTIEMLVELVREGGQYYRRARYWSAYALAELARDTVRVVPVIVKKGGVAVMGQVVKDFVRKTGNDPCGVPLPLLRPVLDALKRIAEYPLGAYTFAITEEGLQQPLVAVGSNVALQLKYCGIKDRVTLGDIARDILFVLQDGQRFAPPPPAEEEEEEKEELVKGEVGIGEGEQQEIEFNGEEKKDGPVFDGTYTSMGVTTVGSLGANLKGEEETHTTRLAQLDAEDPTFRNELRRRKEHYEMGATYRLAREPISSAPQSKGTTPKSGGSRGRGASPKNQQVTKKSKVVEKIEGVKELRGSASTPALSPTSSAAANATGSGEFFNSMGRGDVVDVSFVPMMAMTRPSGPIPSPKKEPQVSPSPLLTQVVVESNTKLAGKQLVTFKRPVKSAGLFIDPTFVDNEPTTEQKYDELGNQVGKPRLMSSNSLTSDKPFEQVEEYSHEVDIMGSKVKVTGKRVAGPEPMLDDEGRPLSAITFENVHGSSVQRELARLKADYGPK
jgi:hypothetical protein